jgi:putative transposase
MKPRKRYPTDVSDKEWAVLEPLLPRQDFGRPAQYAVRELINGIRYVLRSGCSWRMLPHDLPPWSTVYRYFRKLEAEGYWQRLNEQLRETVREAEGRAQQPSQASIDSQSVRTTEKGGHAAMTTTNG